MWQLEQTKTVENLEDRSGMCAHCFWGVNYSKAFSVQRTGEYVYTNIFTSTFLHLFLYILNHEFILLNPIPAQPHRFHFFCIHNSILWQKHGSTMVNILTCLIKSPACKQFVIFADTFPQYTPLYSWELIPHSRFPQRIWITSLLCPQYPILSCPLL